jgi:hypothetical protein
LKGLKIANQGILHSVIHCLTDLIFPSGLMLSAELNFSHGPFLMAIRIGLGDQQAMFLTDLISDAD